MVTTTVTTTRLRGFVRASHAGPTVMVTAMSTALVVGAGAPGRTVLLATAAVLTGQLSVGWSNDWVDAARDRAVARPDKPVVDGVVTRASLGRAAATAALVCVPLSLATGLVAGGTHLVAVASAWAYNLGLKATVWSWAPYAVSFGLLPVFLVGMLEGSPAAPAWLVVGAALLGVGAHVANVLPDLEEDRRTGVVGLPHRLGRRGSVVLAPALLLAAVLVVVTGPGSAPQPWVPPTAAGAAVVAVAGGVVGLTRPRSRLPFGLSMAVAGLCVVLIVAVGPLLGRLT